MRLESGAPDVLSLHAPSPVGFEHSLRRASTVAYDEPDVSTQRSPPGWLTLKWISGPGPDAQEYVESVPFAPLESPAATCAVAVGVISIAVSHEAPGGGGGGAWSSTIVSGPPPRVSTPVPTSPRPPPVSPPDDASSLLPPSSGVANASSDGALPHPSTIDDPRKKDTAKRLRMEHSMP